MLGICLISCMQSDMRIKWIELLQELSDTQPVTTLASSSISTLMIVPMTLQNLLVIFNIDIEFKSPLINYQIIKYEMSIIEFRIVNKLNKKDQRVRTLALGSVNTP